MRFSLTALAFAAALAAVPAQAAPVLSFDVAGAPASSASVTVQPGPCAICSATTQLDANLDNQIFDLGAGESKTFDFFRLTVGGLLGVAPISVSATLAFDTPAGEAAQGIGNGFFVTFFGTLNGGVLNWNDLPAITLGDGSRFSVDFSDIAAFGFGNTATVTATVTALDVAAPVPEPGAIALLGLGALGLGLRSSTARGLTVGMGGVRRRPLSRGAGGPISGCAGLARLWR